MSQFGYQQFYHRNRPHLQPPGATLFVTFRLAGSVPQAVVRQYQAEKVWLEKEWQRIRKLASASGASEIAAHEDRLRTFHRRWFRKFEDLLHAEKTGPTWLKEERLARVVSDSLHYLDGQTYRLDAYCIMSNHVHAVFALLLSEERLQETGHGGRLRYESAAPTLAEMMQSLKGYTAREANRLLGRRGTFWEHESYDHVVRDAGEFDRIVTYVLNNPVKAGLVRDWRQWRWNWRRQP